jgi:hypothetical protein
MGRVLSCVIAPALLLAAPACDEPPRRPSSLGATAADTMGAALADAREVVVRTHRKIEETSGLAASATHRDVLFAIDDSGNDPMLFALDTTGADRGAWRVSGATNVDWEALAMGPCGPAASRCIYIGDVGDNGARHPTRVLYRIREPEPLDSAHTGKVAAEHVTFTYPDGKHDVEAMYVAPAGDVYLITKRPSRSGAFRLRHALVFRVPSSAWSTGRAAVAQLVDSLSIVPGSAPFRTITDASLAPDGRHLAVRTYSQLYVYAVDSTSGRVDASIAPSICNLVALDEAQGEGLAWLAAGGRFAFSSEGKGQPLRLASCPPP